MSIKDTVERINKKYGKEVCQLGIDVHQKETHRDIEKTRWYKSISIDYLRSRGVLNVTKNGIVISTEGKIIPCHPTKSGKKGKVYMTFALYDIDDKGNKIKIRAGKNKDKYSWTNYKVVTIGLHRAVYLFNNNDGVTQIPVGYDVDHIDNNPLNNDISNLQLLTRADNLAKDRKPSKWKARLTRKNTLEQINDKIEFYTNRLETLKQARTNENRKEIHEACHKTYSVLAQWKNRRRQYLELIEQGLK